MAKGLFHTPEWPCPQYINWGVNWKVCWPGLGDRVWHWSVGNTCIMHHLMGFFSLFTMTMMMIMIVLVSETLFNFPYLNLQGFTFDSPPHPTRWGWVGWVSKWLHGTYLPAELRPWQRKMEKSAISSEMYLSIYTHINICKYIQSDYWTTNWCAVRYTSLPQS